jgi:hypothetical protein
LVTTGLFAQRILHIEENSMIARGMKAALAVTLCLTLGALLLTNLSTPAPAAALAEKHPKIRAALSDLRDARDELKAADTDFGGHKKAALEAVNIAIDQLKICIDND